ncbi:Short chain dehydrogenase [Mycena venus]|uniref:Short chain dehydrogenase n=1 Tax=Mycena venus TaxID=2733690 RepID=A0A8H6XYM0_9AGAR|nr:Short chain dehydrogenase [Mycena venus]
MKFNTLFVPIGAATAIAGALPGVAPASAFPPAHVDLVIDVATYMAHGGLANTAAIRRGTQEHNIVKRTPGNVYLCTEPNFTGYCVYITGAFNGGCVDLAFDLDNKVASFGPDEGQACEIRLDHGCTGNGLSNILWPGIADLRSPYGLANVVSSYHCFW